MKLEQDLFKLSNEEESTSKMLYDGKIIKCLVAPYHTQNQLQIDYAPNIYLFPEKEITHAQCKQLISLLVKSPLKEAMIITSDINIILDMYDGCIRILTEDERIIPSPEKTFCANPHTIKYCLLENEAHQISKEKKVKYHKDIEKLIKKINKGKMTQKEYDETMSFIDKIGEQLISSRLKDMMYDVKITK